ncbi:MAG: hypothetical protein ACRCYS_02510 [Beijerinckiaceae bacterium]
MTTRLISGTKREDDAQDASLRPQIFADFGGQAAVKAGGEEAGTLIRLALKELAR